MRDILRAIATIAIILWLLGMLGLGSGLWMWNLIHILLVIAVISILYNIISGRKPM